MIATFVNAAAVIIGSLLGMAFKNGIKERYTTTIFQAISTAVIVMGVKNAIGTNDMLCVIICLCVGTVIGEWIDIDKRLEHLGEFLKSKLKTKHGNFTQGFVTASLLFCVGSMTIMGSLEAGINGNYDILFSKSVMDGVSSIMFGATLGIGVLFSGVTVLVFQGAITLFSGFIAPFLSAAIITEMSAVGGVMLIGMGLNMLGACKIRLANILPAIFLPALYFFIVGLF